MGTWVTIRREAGSLYAFAVGGVVLAPGETPIGTFPFVDAGHAEHVRQRLQTERENRTARGVPTAIKDAAELCKRLAQLPYATEEKIEALKRR